MRYKRFKINGQEFIRVSRRKAKTAYKTGVVVGVTHKGTPIAPQFNMVMLDPNKAQNFVVVGDFFTWYNNVVGYGKDSIFYIPVK